MANNKGFKNSNFSISLKLGLVAIFYHQKKSQKGLASGFILSTSIKLFLAVNGISLWDNGGFGVLKNKLINHIC